ncbi:unnamed protein product [Trifolium pratense]|uniref:Uncharacterized protein n=1 Tax=Trifolium pratense TaxID=57577 RepID=A0ACB0JWX4_TRIPR|nr:unnamed protein product [Trifolium pratense]
MPARLPMEEFQKWTDDFNLVHLPTNSAEFTWENGRGGLRHTERRLDKNQIQTEGPSEELLHDENLSHVEFETALNRQKKIWKEKANLNWHLEGDRNTKYFHRIVKIKSSTKMITSLQDGEQVLIDQRQISQHVVSFYKKLFCSNNTLQEPWLADEVIPKLITEDINALMTMLPSHQEIKAAVFALNKDSAPGPDGFGAFFFNITGRL